MRVVKVMYLVGPTTDEPVTAGLPVRVAALVTAAGVLFFGLYPRPLLELARTAAEVLTGAS